MLEPHTNASFTISALFARHANMVLGLDVSSLISPENVAWISGPRSLTGFASPTITKLQLRSTTVEQIALFAHYS